jgi:hypothetical protein
MVVEDDGQPRARRAAVAIQDEDVELGVVGLPQVVRVPGLAAVDQLVLVAQGGRAFVGQGHQVRVEAGHDRGHAAVRGDRPPMGRCDLFDLARDRGRRWARAGQRQALDQAHQLGREPAATTVGSLSAGQGAQAAVPVAGQPALRGSGRYPGLAGGTQEWDTLFQVRT